MRKNFNIKQLLKWGIIGAVIGACWNLIWVIIVVVFNGTLVKEFFWKIMVFPYTLLERCLFEGNLINKHNAIGFWAISEIFFGLSGFLIGVIVFFIWRFVKHLLYRANTETLSKN